MRPEWPPHPGRLHHALTAAAFALGGDEITDDGLAALRWLEKQRSPLISCPSHVSPRTAPVFYVPRNLSRSEVTDVRRRLRVGEDVQRQIGRNDRRFPTTVTGDQPVWFVWPDSAPDERTEAALVRLTEAIQYLGSSRSPVACAIAPDPPEPTHVPNGTFEVEALRVAYEGLTDELVQSRERERMPGLGATVIYGTPGSVEQAATQGPFGSMLVRARAQGFALTVQHATLIASRFRTAILSQAGDDAPPIIHGHGRNPHLGFVALPNVGSRYADGAIMGVAAVIPADCSPAERAAVAQAVSRVKTLTLTRDVRPWKLEEVDFGARAPRALQPGTWMRPSIAWATVTPIFLDRHPKKSKGEAVEDMVCATLANVGLPEPTRLEINRHPFFPGAIPAGLHKLPGDRDSLATHLHVEFHQPVQGPLLAGRGRYLGIGLLKPVRTRDENAEAGLQPGAAA